MEPVQRGIDAFPRREEHGLERLDAAPGLERAEVLHREPEDPGKLGKIIDVAARCEHGGHIARGDSGALLGRQGERAAIGLLVGEEGGAVCRVVEGVTHGVERKAALGKVPVEQRGAQDGSAQGAMIAMGMRHRSHGLVSLGQAGNDPARTA
jgi:hypothetical protein